MSKKKINQWVTVLRRVVEEYFEGYSSGWDLKQI